MKRWRILVSSKHVGKALERHLCDLSHAHARCEGSRTAGTAIYPKKLRQLIHAGLDAHERAAGAPSLACIRGLTSRSHVARSVVEPFVGRDKVSLADPPSPKAIEPSVGRDGDVDIEDPCCQLAEVRNRNPLILSSAAVTVCELAGNQPSVDVVDKPEHRHKEAAVPGTALNWAWH